MTYSFTQISQYLRCPRQYRYRYLDGWREKEDKASMMFGRCFETALAAYFAREDCNCSVLPGMAQIPGRLPGVCEERLLGPPLSPGHSPARTVCPG